jgi:hypothetical protein
MKEPKSKNVLTIGDQTVYKRRHVVFVDHMRDLIFLASFRLMSWRLAAF